MLRFFLLGFLAFAGAANVREFVSDKEQLLKLFREMSEKSEVSELVGADDSTQQCIINGPEYTDEDAHPSPIAVNECIDEQTRKDCIDFDVNGCGNQECILGYETDENGCVVSCQCRAEGIFEGDIMVDESQVDGLKALYGLSPSTRAASKYKRRWNNIPAEDGTFVVPYVLSPEIRANPKAVAAIRAAMEAYAQQTCLRFKVRTTERDYLKFIVGRGCYSYIGRLQGGQPVSIGRYCEYKGIVMHELMHAMGFWHEQSRPDRDTYVTIVYQNIKQAFANNFRKISSVLIDSMGSPYDFGSVMHYGGYSFSKNRKPTIVSRMNGRPVVQQRRGFSEEDARQLNMMYNCEM